MRNQEPLLEPAASDQMIMTILQSEQVQRMKAMILLAEEEQEDEPIHNESTRDQIDTLANGQTILRYESFLQHQRYYDDLKHVDCNFIDYSTTNGTAAVVIEQDKSLGKGGLCWDAAFILAEHILCKEQEALQGKRMVELGAGTGLCGLLIATGMECHVDLTDLSTLLPIMTRNYRLNFHDDDNKRQTMRNPGHNISKARLPLGTASTTTLTWGSHDEYPSDPYDIILGADVVASLYDPICLAETMWDLSHAQSVVYISYKGRLTEPHERFEHRLKQLFHHVDRLKPYSQNKNPHVWVLKASGRCTVKGE